MAPPIGRQKVVSLIFQIILFKSTKTNTSAKGLMRFNRIESPTVTASAMGTRKRGDLPSLGGTQVITVTLRMASFAALHATSSR